MVALVGRELYESSKTKKLECPTCTGIGFPRTRGNESEWENGRCAKAENNPDLENMMFEFEYALDLREDISCCSVMFLYQYKDPFIISVMQLLKNG